MRALLPLLSLHTCRNTSYCPSLIVVHRQSSLFNCYKQSGNQTCAKGKGKNNLLLSIPKATARTKTKQNNNIQTDRNLGPDP